MSDENFGFGDIVCQMRAANSMLAKLIMANGAVKQRDMILALKATELPAAEIAMIVGTTTNTVQVTISQAKRSPKKKRLKLEDKGNG